MKELEVWLKSIADGLKVMAEGIHTVAKMVEDMANAQAPKKPKKAKSASKRKAKPAPKKATKRAKLKRTRPLPATDQVLNVLKKSKAGVDNATIAKQTWLDKKQVSNVLFRLKKSGKVKSVKRGVYSIA